MKISGFTIVRNAIKYDYPLIESISSILPIVDEFIVNVGNSEDNTLELIRSIPSGKIKVIESTWDDSIQKYGLIFSIQTNIALSHCTGDWAFYLQADEVIHEKDLPKLVAVMEKQLDNPRILGLMFRYLHFYGDYYSLNPWFYHKAIRIIRNNGSVKSCGDAVGFCTQDGHYLNNLKDRWIHTGVKVYHYGYVKNSLTLLEKMRYQISRYHGNQPPPDEAKLVSQPDYSFENYDIMKEFRGTHPKVMERRIKGFPRLMPRRNRWLNWRFYREVFRHGFKG